jgi:tetratricopeptide (TPR) repeat protein
VNEETLRQLIAGGESATVEFKIKAPRPTELAERICGMANTRSGGVIIFGVVDATREPVGLAEPGETIDIALRAARMLKSALAISDTTIQRWTLDARTLVTLHVPGNLGTLYQYDGAFLVRRGTHTVALALGEIHAYLNAFGINGDRVVVCLCRLAEDLWYLGYPDQASRIGQESLALARALAHPFSLTYAAYFDTQRHVVARSLHEVLVGAEATIEFCREYQVHHWRTFAIILRGWAQALRGAAEIGMAQIHEGMAILAVDGTVVGRPLHLTLLAELYAQAGDVEQGLAVLAEALATADAHGERWSEAEIYRVRGELQLLQGDNAEAEAAFLRALEVACSQEAKSLKLRAATSLARLWQTQGKPAAAQRPWRQCRHPNSHRGRNSIW